MQSKIKHLGFLIASPFVLPMTALRNTEIDYNKMYYDQTFEVKRFDFLVIYSGAV